MAKQTIKTAAIKVGGTWCPLDVEDLADGTVTFLDGADQCDSCGYPLDGTDEGPNAIKVRSFDGAVDKGAVIVGQVICQCGMDYRIVAEYARNVVGA